MKIRQFLRKNRIYPVDDDTNYTYIEKVNYCRLFYKHNIIFSRCVDAIIDFTDIERSSENYDQIEKLIALFKEFLLTGEIIYFKQNNLLIPAENVKFENNEIVIGDKKFNENTFFVYKNNLTVKNGRGEPPFFKMIPYCVHIQNIIGSAARAVSYGTRLMGRVVTTAGLDPNQELDVSDDIIILRTTSPADTVEMPRYTPPDISGLYDIITSLIAMSVGIPKEMLFQTFAQTSFSTIKAIYAVYRDEVNRWRNFINYLNSRTYEFELTWPEIDGPDRVDIAKAETLYDTNGA